MNYFAQKGQMTAYARQSGLEIIRCKQPCGHVGTGRPAILLVKGNVIVNRLVRCKVCFNKTNGHEKRI